MSRPADAWTLITTVSDDAQFRAIARLFTDGLTVDEICALNLGDWELGWTDDGELDLTQPARRCVGLSGETEADVSAWYKQVHREDNFGEPLFTMDYTLGYGVTAVSGHTRIPVEVLTLAVARLGAVAGVDVTPLLARTTEVVS